ncbi:MAG: PEGA domain-containing protein [Deltaproteobacteria bacterium]|nr:PEGA domain-containing protein [Deltaproteobacteria bacterium]
MIAIALVLSVVASDASPKGTRVVASVPIDEAALERVAPSPITLSVVTDEGAEVAAQKKVERARAECDAAHRLAQELKTDAALAKFEAAGRVFERALWVLGDLGPIARCHLNEAAAWIDKGKLERATSAFELALRLAPKLEPDPNLYNPDVVAAFKRSKAELQKRPAGSVTIVSEPAGAEVVIDGVRQGRTPLSLSDVTVGEHWLVVRARGYAPFVSRLTVQRQGTARSDVFLKPLDEDAAPLLAAIDKAAWSADDLARARMVAGGHEWLIVVAQHRERVAFRVVRPATGSVGVLQTAASLEEALLRMRADLAAPAAIAEPAPAPPASVALQPREPASPRAPVNPFVALLPFGVGQFVERRPVPATLLLVTQLGLLATNLATTILIAGNRIDATNTYRNPEATRALQIVNIVSFSALIADMIAGGIDGIVHRTPPEPL